MHLPLVRTMDILWIIFVCQVVRCFTVAPAGLCERHRVISQHNNNCGSGCEGLCDLWNSLWAEFCVNAEFCRYIAYKCTYVLRNFVVSCHMRGLICWHEERQCMKCRGPILDTKKCPVTCQEEQADGILIKDMRNVEIGDCWEDTTVPNERQT